MEDSEDCEFVCVKDSRHKRLKNSNFKKRNNVKETVVRNEKMDKRNNQRMGETNEESDYSSDEQPVKNQKKDRIAERQLKKELYEQDLEDCKKKPKGKDGIIQKRKQ